MDKSNEHKSKYCTFYIVRHGETVGNVNRILQGHIDLPLTEEGIVQAKMLAQKLASVKFDHAFSSDLLRAKRTAEIIAIEHKLAVIAKKILRERTFGIFEGKSYDVYDNELKEAVLTFESLTEKEKYSFKFRQDIESDEEIATRFITFIREVSLAFVGKNVLVVSHGGIMRATLIHLGFGTYKTLQPGAVKNLGYFKLESDGVDFFVRDTEGIIKST